MQDNSAMFGKKRKEAHKVDLVTHSNQSGVKERSSYDLSFRYASSYDMEDA